MTQGTVGVRVFGSAMAIALGTAVPAWAHGTTERVSLGPGGVQGDSSSGPAAISADGRFVAFGSYATNLVSGDTNGEEDVFVRDRKTGTTRRVSLGPGGIQGNFNSLFPSLSADGRFVAFLSSATNLVPADTNEQLDVFVGNRQTGRTERVSLGPGGVQGNEQSGVYTPSFSAHGRFVAFDSYSTNLVPGDTNGHLDVFVHDRQTGTTRRVSLGQGSVQGNGVSFAPSLSADGRFVAFGSYATNLVPGDTNGQPDVFVRDRQTRRTERVSLGPGGVQANEGLENNTAISADGRFVAFTSDATNLVPGDTNGQPDVFVRDRQTRRTERVSLGPGGVQSNEGSFGTEISADGRFVGFTSDATNLVPGDTSGQRDAFVRDRKTGTTLRVSLGPGSIQGDGDSGVSAISADGRFVAFDSYSTNLVPGDTNGFGDVFVRVFVP